MDTVKIKHFYPTLICDNFRNIWKYHGGKRNPTWVWNDKDSRVPNLTMIQTPNGIWHLSAEASLPKLIYGHNSKLLNQSEVNSAIDLMGKYAEVHSGLEFDIETARVATVHYAKDFELTESQVWRMIRKLSAKTLPRMDKLFYNDTTLYFKAKTSSIRIYPKLQEVLARKNPNPEAVKLANNKLRIECCLTSNYAINSTVKKFGLTDRTSKSLINEKFSNSIIAEVLESLDFDTCLENEMTILDSLLEQFTAKRAGDLFGFLQIANERGENFFKDKTLKYSKDSYYRNIRDCRKAGVWKRFQTP